MKTILLTWATGYIGSHTAVEFIKKWQNIIILDNLYNSDISTLENIEKITWIKPKFYEADIKDKTALKNIFQENKIDAVIHFAWLKAVWESCEKPFLYYENNIVWSLNLFEIMDEFEVKKIIFSSSATVYDSTREKSPFTENNVIWNTTNPYWTTKLILENILRDLSNHRWFKVINLRYFNPIWAHKSWLLWENPNDIPNNLLPYVMKVLTWELEYLQVFGWDYNTKDWTWERDYIHVEDLAESHYKAFEFIENASWKVYEEINIWTGISTSVLEIIKMTNKVTWKELPYKIVERRAWDIAICYCDATKAKKLLNWESKYSIKEAIEDQYKFVRKMQEK